MALYIAHSPTINYYISKSYCWILEASNTDKPENTAQKRGLLNAIRLPIVNMIPRKLRSHNAAPGDAETGLDTTKQAELASMETLDDNKSTEKVETEDGMENVKLDIDVS